MRIDWSALALDDRNRIFDYDEIDQDTPRVAIMVDERIEQQIEVLLEHPDFGRPGRVRDTRELVISRTPYLVAYRVVGDVITVLRVLHGRQLWPADM